ncbi:hypothetical protein ACFL9T_14955 [Thermodesulfobacteriota bacterium]
MDKIGTLKKVTLSLEAGSEPDTMNITAAPVLFEFIYGIGAGGLSPFECELAEKSEGEELVLHLKGEEISSAFQHLMLPFSMIPEDLDVFYLKAKITDIRDAEQREVVRALAEATTCCDDCGGH